MNIDTSKTPATGSITTDEGTVPPPGSGTPASTPQGKAKIRISFLMEDTDAEMIVDSDLIQKRMDGNKAYPAPDPTLAEIHAAHTAFVLAVSLAKDSKIALGVRRQRRAVLAGLLRRLAHYVQVTCAGDLPTLQSSGFPAQRVRGPVGALSAPAGLRLSRSKLSGQIIARCQRDDRVGAYVWRYAPAATPTAWSPIVVTLSAKAVFEGLAPATAYVAQVSAVGTAGPSDWSDFATVTVL